MTDTDGQDDQDFIQGPEEVRIGPDGRVAQRFPGANADKPWLIMDIRHYGLTATLVSDGDVADWQRIVPTAAESSQAAS